ncbi:MAG: hypothetical protein MUF33_02195 [Candidatus Nanopelagicales bacterium]|jgi:hypothetical protein|nr:hypothetical protein [Candidatus Nanopelagicales bacterium]
MTHKIRVRLRPPTGWAAALLRRRTGHVPDFHSGIDVAAFAPTRWRRFHHAYAASRGYFWMPCPLCDQPFGGHEVCDTIPDPTRGAGVMICPTCSEQRAARWSGPPCSMCHGDGVYPYRSASGQIVWSTCAACNGHGREPLV